MAVLPFACWALVTAQATNPTSSTRHARALAASVGAASLTALLILAPWLIRNHAATGSWTFPFQVPLISSGNGWWTEEQMTRFAAGHTAAADIGIDARLRALVDAGFLQGFGAAPNADPWLPQWSVAFWIGSMAIVMLMIGIRRMRHMRSMGLALGAMLAAQLLFWMFATHLKSRFLLPCAVPLTVATAVAAAPVLAQQTRGIIVALSALLLTAWSLQPILLMRIDPRTASAVELCASGRTVATDVDGQVIVREIANDLGPGTAAFVQESATLGDAMPLAWIANWQLPPGAVLGSEGDADVFWCHTAPVTATVWDGGPLARVLRAHPDDPAAAVRALSIEEHLTHLAIGESMLARWKTAGWIDPILTPDRVRAVASLLNPVARTVSGGVVYKVPLAQ
jgi:hypothetical protein